MPATDSAMGPTSGSDSSSGVPGDKKTNEWASPAVLGMLVFGLTIILFGLSRLPHPYGSAFGSLTIPVFGGVASTELYLGGLVLGLCGLIGLRVGHHYWGSAFLGYGGFWFVIAVVGLGSLGYAMAGLAFLLFLFTLTFLISSMKHGWGTFLFFLLLFVGTILLMIEFWQAGGLPWFDNSKISAGMMWAVGGEWIVTGFVAWYGGTAMLTNQAYGRKILPV